MAVAAVSATSAALESPKIQLSCNHEIVPGFVAPEKISEVIFDFDGTISLIRAGWQEVMLAQFERHLRACPNQQGDIRSEANDAIYELTGKNTIYQMSRLAQMVSERGGTALSPQEYKREYLSDLKAQVEQRREFLRDGDIADVKHMMVPGAYEFLEALQSAGIKLTLASGTDDADVKIEAELLGVSHFFEGRIFGATAADDDLVVAHENAVIAAKQSGASLPAEPLIGKARVISECLQTVNGLELLGVGDGFVEIMLTKQAGGVALGIAGNEEDPYLGELEPLKLAKLRAEPGKGADIIVPDLLRVTELLEVLGISQPAGLSDRALKMPKPPVGADASLGEVVHDISLIEETLNGREYCEFKVHQASKLFGLLPGNSFNAEIFAVGEREQRMYFVRVAELADVWFNHAGKVLHAICQGDYALAHSRIVGAPIVMLGIDPPLPLFSIVSCNSDDIAGAVLQRLREGRVPA
jgi:phosphoglycolate phosphatase